MHDWAHVVTSARGHWVPGDERGFRSRHAKVISTGDYKSLPPSEEHAGLRRYSRGLARPTITLAPDQRRRIGEALLEKLHKMGIETAVLACGALHTHALFRAAEQDAVEILGRAKQFASHRLRAEIRGKLWGSSSHAERVVSSDRFWESVQCIAGHESDGAWVWVAEGVRPRWKNCDCSRRWLGRRQWRSRARTGTGGSGTRGFVAKPPQPRRPGVF